MANAPCSALGHTALGACLLLLATLGHTPQAQPRAGEGGGARREMYRHQLFWHYFCPNPNECVYLVTCISWKRFVCQGTGDEQRPPLSNAEARAMCSSAQALPSSASPPPPPAQYSSGPHQRHWGHKRM